MKKIFYGAITFMMVISLSSCLKDKGFENKEYGLDGIGETSGKGVGIPEANSAVVFRAFEVSATPVVNYNFLFINLNSANPATEDVHVNLVQNNTLVTNYNNSLSPVGNLVLMPANLYNLPSLKVTIPKGSNSAYLKLNIPSTLLLNPNSNYGFGFSIASIDEAGYVIASNQKNIVVQVNAKNKYDGVWNLSGNHNRPTLDGRYEDITVKLITSGQFSAYMNWPNSSANFIYQGNAIQFGGPNVNAHPIATSAGALSYYGSFTVNYIFDATDKFVAWDQSPYPFTVTNQVGPATTSRYVPASGGNPAKIYANFYYNGNLARMFTDTLTYIAPRP